MEALAGVLRLDPVDLVDVADDPVHEAEAVVALCASSRPELLLLDADGASATQTLKLVQDVKARSPRTRVLLSVTTPPSDQEILMIDYLEAGVDGFIQRESGLAHLRAALQAAASGALVVPESDVLGAVRRAAKARETRHRIARMARSLTGRERDVLRLISEGHRNSEIAHELDISARTVASHVQSLYRKLDVHTRVQAMTVAGRYGIAER